ncbi:MAG: hypothetical protein HQ553_16585 [Chloroflexi bacterium]|nr:hypothetical protein [Chloroflexota bacterium]
MEGLLVASSLTLILSGIMPMLIIGTIVYLIVRRHRDNKKGITAYQSLITYFYTITGASIITITIGISYLAFIILDQAYGDEGEIANALATGFTLMGTGLLVCALHTYGRREVQRIEETATATIRRVYLFFMLALFSIVGLIMLPLSINDTVQYYIEESRYRDDPSLQIAMAIVVVPIWIYYVMRVIRENRLAKLEES